MVTWPALEEAHPWESLISTSQVIVATEGMGIPQSLGTGCCHHEGTHPVPFPPGHPSLLPASPASSRQQHCSVSQRAAAAQERMQGREGWKQAADGTGAGLPALAALQCPFGLSQPPQPGPEAAPGSSCWFGFAQGAHASLCPESCQALPFSTISQPALCPWGWLRAGRHQPGGAGGREVTQQEDEGMRTGDGGECDGQVRGFHARLAGLSLQCQPPQLCCLRSAPGLEQPWHRPFRRGGRSRSSLCGLPCQDQLAQPCPPRAPWPGVPWGSLSTGMWGTPESRGLGLVSPQQSMDQASLHVLSRAGGSFSHTDPQKSLPESQAA